MDLRPDDSAPRPARLAATLALGLGVGPALALLAPWPIAALAGCAIGALLLGPLAGRSDARAADSAAGGVSARGAWSSCVLALEAALGTLALLHALNLAALAGAGLLATAGGQPAESAWTGAGLPAPSGWQAFPFPLGAWLLAALAAAWLAHRRGVEFGTALLAGGALAGQAALALHGAWNGTGSVPAMPEDPGGWPRIAAAAALGLLAGVLASGSLPGVVSARSRLTSAAPAGARLGVLAALVVVPGLLAARALVPAPDGPGPSQATPLGDLATLLLGAGLEPAWRAAWLVSTLLAGLAGAALAAQPARAVLQGLLGLGRAGSARALLALVLACGLPLQVLPGAVEPLPAVVAWVAMLLVAVRLVSSRRPTGVALALLALAALGLALQPAADWLLAPTGADAAQDLVPAPHRLVAPALALLLAGAFWPAALGVAAWRSRALRRRATAPAPPGPRPARA